MPSDTNSEAENGSNGSGAGKGPKPDELFGGVDESVAERCPVSVESGEFTVSLRESSFGYVLEHELDQPVIFAARPTHGGWKPFGFLCLSHQTYAKKIEERLEENVPTEIVAIGTETGDWMTVWAADRHDPLYLDDDECESE